MSSVISMCLCGCLLLSGCGDDGKTASKTDQAYILRSVDVENSVDIPFDVFSVHIVIWPSLGDPIRLLYVKHENYYYIKHDTEEYCYIRNSEGKKYNLYTRSYDAETKKYTEYTADQRVYSATEIDNIFCYDSSRGAISIASYIGSGIYEVQGELYDYDIPYIVSLSENKATVSQNRMCSAYIYELTNGIKYIAYVDDEYGIVYQVKEYDEGQELEDGRLIASSSMYGEPFNGWHNHTYDRQKPSIIAQYGY